MMSHFDSVVLLESNRRPIRIQQAFETTELIYYRPLFTFSIFFMIWFAYLFGLFYLIGWSNIKLSPTGPISPPNPVMWYFNIGWWPTCSDSRMELWRLVSNQFVHAGLIHIAGNTFLGIPYVWIFERSIGSIISFVIFEIGVIGGTLFHGNMYPYDPLVGCSHGIYAIIGGLVSYLTFNHDIMDNSFRNVLLCILATQMTCDIVGYFFFFGVSVGYAAHVSAFFIGCLLTPQIVSTPIHKQWKQNTKIIYLILLLSSTSYLIYHYTVSWPTKPMFTLWTPVPVDGSSCCSEVYNLPDRNWSIDNVEQYYTCDGLQIVSTQKKSSQALHGSRILYRS